MRNPDCGFDSYEMRPCLASERIWQEAIQDCIGCAQPVNGLKPIATATRSQLVFFL
jgi:hypothetical protein